MACLMSWTKGTPFDSKFDNIQMFNELMENRKWRLDNDRVNCKGCRQPFSMWTRRHHCRLCGDIYCHSCCTLQDVACCYRQNLNIKTCQSCFTMYSERIHRFHALQSQWMLDEKRVSDCTIQNHPKLESSVKDSGCTTLKSVSSDVKLSPTQELAISHEEIVSSRAIDSKTGKNNKCFYVFFATGIFFFFYFLHFLGKGGAPLPHSPLLRS